MKFPNLEGKHKYDSMINPEDFLKYSKEIGRLPDVKAPSSCIIIYSSKLESYIKEKLNPEMIEGVISGNVYSINNGSLWIVKVRGIGAPNAAVVLEELIALGIKKFINLGYCGSIQKEIGLGSVLLIDRAIRDEGCSHHYIEPSKYAYPSDALTEEIRKTLEDKDIEYSRGTTWTIDAPYRETVEEVKHYQEEGVVTVEMEASALFAVAQYRKVDIAFIATISDYLGELQWKPRFNETEDHMIKILDLMVEML